MTSFGVRAMEARDTEAILAIQAASPEIAQWTLWDYERVVRGEMAGWIVEAAGEVAGFLVARRIATDLEILNFAVRPSERRKGIGGSLLDAATAWANSYGAEKAILEVRASNQAALRFYERRNFQVAGRRPRYYTGPPEDALLLTASLPPNQ